jgi:carbamate kinase
VGNILIRVEAAKGLAYDVPLGVCVAETQGEMGYMIAQSLKNRLIRDDLKRDVACVLTQSVVDRDDPSILKPSKPVGRFYTADEAESMSALGKSMMEDAGRGWRRVVPSPKPLSIVESNTVKELISRGDIVVACGGGGMPVYFEDDGTLEGVDGVVDKDLASAVLAVEVGADELIILTEVERVALNFNTPDQRFLDRLNVAEARRYLAEGHFGEGSMRPKIEAVIYFLENGGRKAIIAALSQTHDALHGRSGTQITLE